MLENGNVVLFDNGSAQLGNSAAGCVDPENPQGPGSARPFTRVTEYELDPDAHTATLVWSYQPDLDGQDPFAFFAGSARRLANGNTLIGWADEREMLASEVDADKNLLWEIRTPETANRYTSYRVSLVEYDVRAPLLRPDGMIRKANGSTWRGADIYGAVTRQSVRQRARRGSEARSSWRVQNDGERHERLRLVGPGSSSRWKVRYAVGGTDVTRAVVAGRYRTGVLAPGQRLKVRVTVTPTRRARVGADRVFTLRAISTASSTAIDRVATRVTARR
jgi:hypothetical protein